MSFSSTHRAVVRALARPVSLAIAVVVAVAGCGDDSGGFAAVDPANIVVSPRVVSFNQIAIGETETQAVTIENRGGSGLVVTSWRWVGTADDFSVEGLDGLRVAGHDLVQFSIVYQPSDEAPDDATLVIESNAGSVEVDVTSLGEAAVLRAEPAAVDLVSDTIGLRVEQTVTLLNAGTEPLEIGEVSLVTATTELGMSLDFAVPAILDVSESVEVTLSYNPNGRGSDEGSLVVEHDGANAVNGISQVPVTASVRSPFLVLDPEFVGFEAVPRDETRTEQVTVSNTGETALRVTDLYLDFASSPEMSIVSMAGIPFVDGAFETLMIEPDQSELLEVAYTPTDNEPDNATVLLASNDPDFPIMPLPMGGRLAAPYLSVTPEVLGFGSVAGGLVRRLSVIVRNAGTETLELDAPVITGGQGSFTMFNADLFPSQLEPDQGFELLVDFSPTAEGSLEGELTITSSNDPDHSPAVVFLNGFGAGAPVCNLTVTPTTINFGLVPRGSSRIGRAAVRNTGSGNCQIGGVVLSSPPFGGIPPFDELFSDAFSLVSVDAPPGGTLGPGETFLVEAQYAPRSFTVFSETSLGDTGSITINVTDPADPGRTVTCGSTALFNIAGFARECGINLQGTSGVAELAAIPAEVDFGLVTRGCNSQDITVNLYNIGSAPVTISGIGLESCTAEFSLTGVPPEVSGAGYVLASGSPPLPLHVRYAPTALGSSTCNLVIESDAETASRLVVPLTGEGTDSSAQTDHFEQVSGQKVDVLFVVDNSASMSEEQTNLANNFGSFIAEAQTWDNDFQIGVITTEADEEFNGRAPGELVGSPRILVPETSNLANAFANNALVGDAGDGARESGLEAAWLALSDPLLSDVGACDAECTAPYACVPNARGTESRCGGYNRSLVREDASLEVVFLSDEEDQSRGTVEFYTDFLRSIKGEANQALFHASAIVGPLGGCSTAAAGERYLDVAVATGGVSASICDSNFASSLADIGDRAFGLRVQFFLSRVAEPVSVTVTHSSGGAMTGWSFDEASNSVVFTEATTPPPGTEFDVSYTARCF